MISTTTTTATTISIVSKITQVTTTKPVRRLQKQHFHPALVVVTRIITTTTSSITSNSSSNSNSSSSSNRYININVNNNKKDEHFQQLPIQRLMSTSTSTPSTSTTSTKTTTAVATSSTANDNNNINDQKSTDTIGDNNNNNNNVGPITIAYQQQIALGWKQYDTDQLRLAQHLDQLYKYLQSTDSHVIPSQDLYHYPQNTIFQKLYSRWTQKVSTLKSSSLFSPSSLSSSSVPKGLYIHGSVGVGKSFLMDLFHDTIINNNHNSNNNNKNNNIVSNRKIRRVHFHEFMLDVHYRIHQHKQQQQERKILRYQQQLQQIKEREQQEQQYYIDSYNDNTTIATMKRMIRQGKYHFNKIILNNNNNNNNNNTKTGYYNNNNNNNNDQDDSIAQVALMLAKEARVLCFDEFQVTDIADAMILKRLFEHLFQQYGVIMIATSNRAPQNLYEGGINRTNFLPFLDTLYHHVNVIEMKGTIDYRREQPKNGEKGENDDDEEKEKHNNNDCENINDKMIIDQCYFISNDDKDNDKTVATTTQKELTKIFNMLGGNVGGNDNDKNDNTSSTSNSNQEEEYSKNITLTVPNVGRTITIPRANANVNNNNICAWFHFDDLCVQPLGSADYFAICQQYPVIIIDHIPQLDSSKINEARRFVTLIDAMYETKTKLIASIHNTKNKDKKRHKKNYNAMTTIDDLFVDFDATIETNDGDEEIAIMGQGQQEQDQRQELRQSVVATTNSKSKTPTPTMYVKREGGSSSSVATTMIRMKNNTNKNDNNDNDNDDDGVEVEWSATGRIGVSLAQLSSVRDVSFSFQRAESRLKEMERKSWGRYINSINNQKW